MRAFYFNGKAEPITVQRQIEGNVTKVSFNQNLDFSRIKYIDFEYEADLAVAGDDGYFVLPNSPANEGMLCCFREREDTEYTSKLQTMPIFGVKTQTKSFVAIVTGMAYDFTLVCGVKNGKYYLFPRFELNGEVPYEKISVEYHYLPQNDNDYSAMAREYRNFQLNRGACVPLKERILQREALDYARQSVMIRIRMGWKPVPPVVLEQTPEIEPPMHVACSFDRVSEMLDGFKAAGIEKAEICLVGWNAKGHDGRWPTAFPVCEELGGEEALKKLINKAQAMGYQIVCHTNSSDSYRISPDFREDNLRKDRNGNYNNPAYWSGGHMYELCPTAALQQAHETLPQVRALGFRGIHYIDVLSIVKPRSCYAPQHPLSVAEAIECNNEIMKLSRDLFGGFSSEGAIDFAAKYLDFGLYVSFSDTNQPNICDKMIPFWQLVYHGIILSNPSATTINYPIKETASRLKLIEYGGRPSIYVYSKFVNVENKNWMGTVDLTCETDEDLRYTVEKTAAAYRDAAMLADLQTEFMEKHEEIADGVYRITYSDRTVVTVDYNSGSYTIEKGKKR